MLMETRQGTNPVRLCWSRCIAINPLHIQRLCSTCIDVLAAIADIERECLVFEPLRQARTVSDLERLPWEFLATRLAACAPCPCPRVEEAVSLVRLFATLAVVHHQVWFAKSGSTLKLLGACRLPADLPPELSSLRSEFEQRLAEADQALRTGRAKLAHFQRQALQGYPLLALLWTILVHARTCYQVYRQAIKAAYDLIDYAAWYTARAGLRAPVGVSEPARPGQRAAATRSQALAQPSKGKRRNAAGAHKEVAEQANRSARRPGQLERLSRRSGQPHAETGRAAFCATCPPAEAVADLLDALGFSLTFSMGEQSEPAYMNIASLPPQYHYREPEHGTEVIYLAGQDASQDGELFPPHASRFWVHPGSSAQATQQAAQLLEQTWPLAWIETNQEQERVAVA